MPPHDPNGSGPHSRDGSPTVAPLHDRDRAHERDSAPASAQAARPALGLDYADQSEQLRPRLRGEGLRPDVDDGHDWFRSLRAQCFSAEEGLEEAVRSALDFEVLLRGLPTGELSATATAMAARIDHAETVLHTGLRSFDDALYLWRGPSDHAGSREKELRSARALLVSLEHAIAATGQTVVAICTSAFSRERPERLPTHPSVAVQVRQTLFEAVARHQRGAESSERALALARGGSNSDIDGTVWQVIATSFSLVDSGADAFLLAQIERRAKAPAEVQFAARLRHWLGWESAAAEGEIDAPEPRSDEYALALSEARSTYPDALHRVSRWATSRPPGPSEIESFLEVLSEHLVLEAPPPALPLIPAGLLARAATSLLSAFRQWWLGATKDTADWIQARGQVETVFAVYRSHGAPRPDLLRQVSRQLDLMDDVVIGSGNR